MSTSKIASKIALLLAKAEGTDNAAEQAAYSAKAEQLMLQHGIERAMLAGMTGQEARDEITTRIMEFPGGYRKSHTLATYSVIRALGLNAYKSERAPYSLDPSKHCTRLTIVGPSRDLDDAVILATSIVLQAMTSLRPWWREVGRDRAAMSGVSQQSTSDQYVQGYADGAAERIRAMRATTAQEWESTHGEGTVAVVQNRTERDIREFMDGMNLRAGSSRGSRAAYGASDAGRAAGRRADVGASRVAGRRSLA